MSVDIEPQELAFKREFRAPNKSDVREQRELISSLLVLYTGPFNQEVCQLLRLRNSNEEPLVFKVCSRDFPFPRTFVRLD